MTTPAQRNAQAIATAMPEADLLEAVFEQACSLGLLAYHTHDSRRSLPGFPDLVIVGPGGVLWRELKDQTRDLTREQRRWRTALQATGQDWALWRPLDLLSGQIHTELSALTVRYAPAPKNASAGR